MVYRKDRHGFYELMEALHLLKFFHEIGIYEKVAAGVREIEDEDYYEFLQSGWEQIAPDFDMHYIYLTENGDWVTEDEIEQMNENDYSDYPNTVYHFSSPQMREYYRLCRLYEHRHSIGPEANPFVKKAARHIDDCVNQVHGCFGVSFDDDRYARELLIEFTPEDSYVTPDLILAIHETLEYYREHVNALRLEMLKWPPVFLPALPAAKGSETDE